MSLSASNKSTLYFYKLPINLMGKNFVLESLSTYLSTLTPLTKSDFQFQRFELDKKIKVNINQEYSFDYTSITKYNYLKVVSTASNNTTTTTYYYFIRSAKQIAQSTIEFELKMDVLNTFSFSATSGNDKYTLSDRSLITREHKDRLAVISKKVVEVTGDEVWEAQRQELLDNDGFTNDTTQNVSFMIDWSGFWQWINSNIATVGAGTNQRKEITISFTGNVRITNASGGQAHNDYVSSIRFYHYISQVFYWATITYQDGETVDLRSTLNAQTKPIVFLLSESNTLFTISANDTQFDDEDGISALISQYVTLYYYPDKVKRIIDRYPESIEAITFKNSEDILLDEDRNKTWYVAYASQNAVVESANDTQPKYVNPVQVDFIKDDGYTLTTSTKSVVRIYPQSVPQISNYEEWMLLDLSNLPSGAYITASGYTINAPLTVEGVTYSYLWIAKINNDDAEFRYIVLTASREVSPGTGKILFEHVQYIDFYNINSIPLYHYTNIGLLSGNYEMDFYIGSGDNVTIGTSPSITSFDLTNPKLIKVINFPYCPRNDLVGKSDFTGYNSDLVWNATNNCLELKKAQINAFDRTIIFKNINPFSSLILSGETYTKRMSRDKKFESKLYHSDYYQSKFVYDSFSFVFKLEDMDVDAYINRMYYEDFRVRYVCSGNVLSKFMFQFTDYVCDREIQDYNNVLVIDRNNEKALFNNAYINYIRSGGYRYDTKTADANKLANGLTIALSTIGAIGSFVSTPYTGVKGVVAGVGLAITTATKTINAIHSAQQADRQIAQKLLSSAQQGTNVSTSEDIDILKAYSGNKAKLCQYRCTSYLEEALWDLFYLFGYKTMEYKVPTVNTRCNFNFVQGEIVLKDYTFNEDIANQIIACWRDGVTFMHYDVALQSYDLNQVYENIENALL